MSGNTRLYPFVPYEEPVTVVVWRMQVVDVHRVRAKSCNTRKQSSNATDLMFVVADYLQIEKLVFCPFRTRSDGVARPSLLYLSILLGSLSFNMAPFVPNPPLHSCLNLSPLPLQGL